MSMFRRSCAVAVTALALILVAAPGASAHTAPQHKATQRSYVALGDSYSAGSGALPPTDQCLRSKAAFPILLAKLARLQLTHAACGGATMDDVAKTQLEALSGSTDYVTVQAGGNDIGFVPVFRACATLDDADCWTALAGAHAYLNSTFVTDASALYQAIRSEAPRAKLVVVGYPRLFNGTNCSNEVYYSPAEQAKMNATIDLLNTRLSQAAASVGAGFAKPTRSFKGHAWCDKASWITPAEAKIAFHPTALGQAFGLLPVVASKLF
ncbi:MAG: SGNH/GDSL hydrolase family protein [Micropruina sp.]